MLNLFFINWIWINGIMLIILKYMISLFFSLPFGMFLNSSSSRTLISKHFRNFNALTIGGLSCGGTNTSRKYINSTTLLNISKRMFFNSTEKFDIVSEFNQFESIVVMKIQMAYFELIHKVNKCLVHRQRVEIRAIQCSDVP